MNGRGVTTIRYIDDFVVLGASERDVMKAWSSGERLLKKLGLEVHQPVKGGSKASSGAVSEGFDFLSFRFNVGSIGVAREAKKRFQEAVRSEIRSTRKEIEENATKPRRAQDMYAQLPVRLDRRVRG